MRFARLDRYFTGVSVPVGALRTAGSCGVGEFADLVDLGRWCADVGLDVIQLLPVNDTGGNSSPYSALSAFALHPLYLRLQDVPGSERHAAEIEAFRAGEGRLAAVPGSRARFAYRRTLDNKLSILERIFSANAQAIRADPAFAAWRADNPWVVPYAVFTALKRENHDAPWAQWPALSDGAPAQITAWWESHPMQCLLAAWTQYLLESQLVKASRALESMKVYLKGDLPILMTRESADVWSERAYFDISAMAGAPPDMFSPDGQNWGFPVYDWERLAGDDYRWWKARLRQAGKFFHAFRIDHVLGFFRIWRIPRGELTGLLGRFSPSRGLSRADLQGAGFDDGRLRWLTLPHITGAELAAALGPDAQRVAGLYLRRVGIEDLHNLRPEVDSESVISGLSEPGAVKSFLASWHANRALMDDGSGMFFPAWYLDRNKGFTSLAEQEKGQLRDLLGQRRAESEAEWERRGSELLAAVQEAADMLVCAEDLGDVPRCVPRVLAGLGILGLRIVRWSRDYDHAVAGVPAPFIPPERYHRLSVCTPSVHDTSTIRGWWEEDAAEREAYYRSLGETGPCPARMTSELLMMIIAHCCGASSLLCMFQVQDLLDMDEALWAKDPQGDRINVPGTVNDENWTWRMPLSIADLAARAALNDSIRAVSAARRARAVREAR